MAQSMAYYSQMQLISSFPPGSHTFDKPVFELVGLPLKFSVFLLINWDLLRNPSMKEQSEMTKLVSAALPPKKSIHTYTYTDTEDRNPITMNCIVKQANRTTQAQPESGGSGTGSLAGVVPLLRAMPTLSKSEEKKSRS